jgi:RND family efflux transporter MFP subunit
MKQQYRVFLWHMLVCIAATFSTSSLRAADRPTASFTQWSDRIELYAEYPLLVAGTNSTFAIHFTHIDGFRPAQRGQLSLVLTGEDSSIHEFTASGPVRPGLFTPDVQLDEPGEYDLSISLVDPPNSETFRAGKVRVYGAADSLHLPHDHATGGITFLKEQQWSIPFATTDVAFRRVQSGLWATCEVMDHPDASVDIAAPVEGIIRVGAGKTLIQPGALVNQGDVLLVMTPPVLGEGWASAQILYEQAKRDFERARSLRERNVISEREFELTENQYLALKSGFESVSADGAADALKLRAPQSGQITEWDVHPGEHVTPGQHLMTVVNPGLVWLRVNLFKEDLHIADQIEGAFVKQDAAGNGVVLTSAQMTLISQGATVDPATRTVPLLFEVENTDGHLHLGELSAVQLYVSGGRATTAVPTSAVLNEGGLTVVYVQTGGETFERRVVELGAQSHEWSATRSGLMLHERVVTRGAYQVQLAASSGEMGHGHAH